MTAGRPPGIGLPTSRRPIGNPAAIALEAAKADPAGLTIGSRRVVHLVHLIGRMGVNAGAVVGDGHPGVA
jgi:hypothetical protein